MAIGYPQSPYGSPLSYSSPMTSMPTTADILNTMPSYSQGIAALLNQPSQPATSSPSMLDVFSKGLTASQSAMGKQKKAQMPLVPMMQFQPMAQQNLLGNLDMSAFQQLMQPQQIPQLTLLDYIQLLGGQ